MSIDVIKETIEQRIILLQNDNLITNSKRATIIAENKRFLEYLQIINLSKCKNCKSFFKTYIPKLSFNERIENCQKDYPALSKLACSTLANNHKLWEQTESNRGFCKYHNIENEIDDTFSCLDFISKLK